MSIFKWGVASLQIKNIPECSKMWLSFKHYLLCCPWKVILQQKIHVVERLPFSKKLYLMAKQQSNISPLSSMWPCQRKASAYLIYLAKSIVTSNLAAYEVFEPSWDALKMRYAAMHIVMLPITVRAPWRATRTCGSSKKTILTKANNTRKRTVSNTDWIALCFCLFSWKRWRATRSNNSVIIKTSKAWLHKDLSEKNK